MFLRTNPSQSRPTRDGEQRAGGPFLYVVMADGVPFREARAFVRSVQLHQCGHFMMGQIAIGGFVASVSGSYGSDGLPADVPRHVYDAALPIPADIMERWATGSGHNGAGEEGPSIRDWAVMNERALRRAGRDLPSNGRERMAWLAGQHDVRAFEYRATPEIPEEIYRDPDTSKATAAIRARWVAFAEICYTAARESGLDDVAIALHPWAALNAAHKVLSGMYPENVAG